MSDEVTRSGARRKGRQRRCPIFGKPVAEAFRPFCSERCRRIDLDRWLREAYRVPGEETGQPGGKKPEEE